MDLPTVDGVTFKLIAGFTCYAVGDDGSVWSSTMRSGARPKGWYPVSTYRRTYGGRYVVVCFRLNDGKGKVICRYVHRLVLEAFVGACPHSEWEGCHGDGNSANNRLSNLRWGSKSDNATDKIGHGKVRAKLSVEQVREIRRLRGEGITNRELARTFKVKESHISSIVTRKSWVTI